MKKYLSLLAVTLLTGCSFFQKGQREWIYEELPDRLWSEQTAELANNEYERIEDLLKDYGNEAIRIFEDDGDEEDLNELFAASLFGLEDFYLLGSSSKEKKRGALVDRYIEQYNIVTDNLQDNMSLLLRLRDSSLSRRPSLSDKILCTTLLGKPDAIAFPSEEEQMDIARTIMTNLFAGRAKPIVTSCSYDRKEKVWNVRLDNAPNQVVQFHKRDDGDYDIEWTGNNGYIPGVASVEPEQKKGERNKSKKSQNNLFDVALKLCEYIPDHGLKEGAKDHMTPEFYNAYAEAWDAPVADYGMIGENEWLYYFVTGNGGSSPSYSVKSVSTINNTSATAIILVTEVWEDDKDFPEEENSQNEAKEYKIAMKCVDGKWLLDDFDNKKVECIDFVKQLRKQYQSGEIIESMQSDEETRGHVEDFKERVKQFYKKWGK